MHAPLLQRVAGGREVVRFGGERGPRLPKKKKKEQAPKKNPVLTLPGERRPGRVGLLRRTHAPRPMRDPRWVWRSYEAFPQNQQTPRYSSTPKVWDSYDSAAPTGLHLCKRELLAHACKQQYQHSINALSALKKKLKSIQEPFKLQYRPRAVKL